MKFEKLLYVIISTVLITAFILVSFISSPDSGNTKASLVKKIYYVDHISPAHQKLIDLFNKKYNGQIEVETINLSFDKFSTNERKELLARYLRSKSDRIDIFAVDQIWVPRFAKWGIPLEKFITPQQKENLLKYAMQSCIYKDTLVAVPLYIDVALMYYRKDLLQQLPDYPVIKDKLDSSITWKDFINLKAELDISNPFFLFPAYDYEGLICLYAEMLAGQNISIYQNDSLKLQTPEAKKSLQLLVDLVNKYNMSPKEVLNFKENPSYDYFINKNGVFLRGWSSFEITYKDHFTSPEIYDNLVKIPPPHFEGCKPASVFGGWNLMISKYSSKINESAIFINFLLSDEAQKIMYEEGGYLPISNSIYKDSLFLAKHHELKFYERLLRVGIHRPFLEKYTNISDILSYYLHMAIKQKISVNTALSKATEKINSESILLK